MTDKVQKIREEVERLMNELIEEKEKGYGSDADDACILELQNVLTYIDSLLKEEPVSEELETFAKKESEAFAEREYEIDYIDRNALGKGYYWGCINGAEWQKEQMMKDAVDGLVVCDAKLTNGYKDICLKIPEYLDVGDKVKLIIIKED